MLSLSLRQPTAAVAKEVTGFANYEKKDLVLQKVD
jgi:hypothetical protein